MAEFNEVYRRAQYYDIAFGRDVTDEVEFLSDLYKQENGRPPASALEMACGPGYHARVFAKRGIRSIGTDLRPEMIEFARDRAEEDGVNVEWGVADIRAFTLTSAVDIAYTTFDSFDCLVNQDEIFQHFRAVAANLTPGGLYVFDVTHPRDCYLWNYGNHAFRGERNGTKVSVEWVNTEPQFDPVTQVVRSDVIMRVTQNGREEIFPDKASERFGSPQEYIALGKFSGALEVLRFYGDYKLTQPFDNSPNSNRMVVVMRKSGAPPR